MTLTKKKKRILLIALPAALAVIAAAVILWLLLGRDTPKALEPLYNQTTGELMGYTVLEGSPKEEENRSLPLPMASFTPPEGWTQTLNAAEYADRFSTGYVDEYQSLENDYTTLTFSQQYAVEGDTLPAGQEVQFGNFQVIYWQEEESGRDLGYHTEVYWVDGPTLFTISYRYAPGADLNQMLELVSRVDTQGDRQPIHSPLTLARGSYTPILMGENTYSAIVTRPRSEGNPEIPQDAQFVGFSQPPEGYLFSELYEENNNHGNPEFYTWGYYHSEDNQKWIRLDCWLDSNACNSNGSREGGFGIMSNATDSDAILDATVHGNPAFVYLAEDGCEIGWVEGYRTYSLTVDTPMTAEQLIALAEMVEVPEE